MTKTVSLSAMKRAEKQARHDWEVAVFLGFEEVADQEVRDALRQVVRESSLSDTLGWNQKSLRFRMETLIDPAVQNWLSRNDVSVEWKFSEVIMAGSRTAELVLKSLARLQPDEEFLSTANYLIGFQHFCNQHFSDLTKYVRFEPPKADKNQPMDEVHARFDYGYKSGARKLSSKGWLPRYLSATRDDVIKQGLCISCGQQTMAEEERQRLLSVNIGGDNETEIKDHLRSGGEFTSKDKGSSQFCNSHAEMATKFGTRNEANAIGKKARRKATVFLGVIYFLKREELNRSLSAFLTPELVYEFARQIIIRNESKEGSHVVPDAGEKLIGNSIAKIDGEPNCDIAFGAIRKLVNVWEKGAATAKLKAISKVNVEIERIFRKVVKWESQPYRPPQTVVRPDEVSLNQHFVFTIEKLA